MESEDHISHLSFVAKLAFETVFYSASLVTMWCLQMDGGHC